jgi:uncharacterized protein YodC (DUF2158 family)
MANVTVEFEIGDVVSLVSGGPNMTVSGFDDDTDLVECTYFSYGDEDFKVATFNKAMLVIEE